MFETYKLNDKGMDEVKAFKAILSEAVDACLRLMPEGREKQIFKTKVEEAGMFGARSVAGKVGNHTDVVPFSVTNT